MSVGLLSDEVAEDYKNSLEDLTLNSRYEISNLTVIAKENTEHAMQISRVLENHIRNASPDRKLPALYVLDSVVKNVGTPYTLFLGRNLYQTFMHAYSQVNTQVRNKLNEMLKTWKEPVPGSQDPRPVFPQDTTRPIENALIKLKTMDLAKQQQETRNQQALLSRTRPVPGPATAPPVRWPNSPAPPVGSNVGYPPASSFASRYPQQNGQNNYVQEKPRAPYPQYNQQPPQHTVPPQFQQPQQQPYQQPPIHTQPPTAYHQNTPPIQSLDPLHQDIEDLIVTTKREFASAPFDTSTQARLKALLDLQTILRTTVVSPMEMQQIRNQVAQLSLPRAPVVAPVLTPVPPAPAPYLAPPPPQQTPQPTPDLQALLSSNALADILAKATKAQQPSIPAYSQAPLPQPQVPPAQPYTPPAPMPATSGSSLIESLRAAGMLPGQPSQVNGSISSPLSHGYPPPPFSNTPSTPPSVLLRPAVSAIQNDIQLTTASLKIPRPHLISRMYEARPNQCSTCGRRFLATEEGRTKKARHLDWHFRTNQRIADSVKRGQSRSWYVDELEWIKNREAKEEDISNTPNGAESSPTQAAVKAAKEDPKNKYIPVPADAALANLPCPICQEKFVMSWNDEAQDFVWMDAVKIGARVYHASCHAEVQKDGGSTPLRTSTPDSVLGKRKAGGTDTNVIRSKVQRATP